MFISLAYICLKKYPYVYLGQLKWLGNEGLREKTKQFSNQESCLLSPSHTFAIIVILDFTPYLLKRHWTSSTSSPNFFPKKLRFFYTIRSVCMGKAKKNKSYVSKLPGAFVFRWAFDSAKFKVWIFFARLIFFFSVFYDLFVKKYKKRYDRHNETLWTTNFFNFCVLPCILFIQNQVPYFKAVTDSNLTRLLFRKKQTNKQTNKKKQNVKPNVSPHKLIIKDDDVKECISIE